MIYPSFESINYYLVDMRFAIYAGGILSAVYIAAVWKIGSDAAAAKSKGLEPPQTYPPGYFLALAIQLFPLFVTGMALGDSFIALTRGVTLLFVIWAYAQIKNPTAVLEWRTHKYWMIAILSILVVGGTVWAENYEFRAMVKSHHTAIGWTANATMILFFIFGQRPTAKAIWSHFREGGYNHRGFGIQWVRFFNFVLQGYFYLCTVTILEGLAQGLFDPRVINGAVGAVGAGMIIFSYIHSYFSRPTRAKSVPVPA